MVSAFRGRVPDTFGANIWVGTMPRVLHLDEFGDEVLGGVAVG